MNHFNNYIGLLSKLVLTKKLNYRRADPSCLYFGNMTQQNTMNQHLFLVAVIVILSRKLEIDCNTKNL